MQLREPYKIGTIYQVELKDCCIEGSFTSTLTGMGPVEDEYGEDMPDLYFENGVMLTQYGGCVIAELVEK